MSVANMKVLIDHTGTARMALNESKEDKRLYAEGKIGQCDVPTANGRVYPRSIIEREIAKLQEKINNSSLLGAVDHPNDGRSRIMESGHIVRKLWIEKDGAVYGKFEIVEESDAGRNLAAFLKHGASIGVSSRGLGSTRMNEQGQEVVTEDFRLSSYDFVSDPAVSTAFPQFFTEDKDQLAQVTVEALKVKFPHLVQKIEESAYQAAKDVCLEATRLEIEDQAEEVLKLSKEQLKEGMKAELVPEIIKELRDDFGVKLIRSLQSMRKEVEESVRSELSSDPKVAGAKLALEQVAKLVMPFNPPADVKKLLGEKDSAITECKVDLASNKKAVEEANQKVALAEDKARKLAYSLFIEQKTSGRADSVQIKSMLGEVSQFKSASELKTRLEGILSTADQANKLAEEKAFKLMEQEKKVNTYKLNLAQTKADRLKKEKDNLSESFEQQVKDLSRKLDKVVQEKDSQIESMKQIVEESRGKSAKLEESLNESIQLAEKLRLAEFAEERSIGHPKRKNLLESVSSGKVKTKKELNKLAEDLEDSAEEPGGIGERMRRLLGKGKETLTEAERVHKEKRTTLGEIEDLTALGIPLEEVTELASAKFFKDK